VERDDRVVITGVGLAVPLGVSVDEVWQRSVRGESAIGPFRRFEPKAFACQASAEVPEVELGHSLRYPKNEKFMTRGVRYAMHAATTAVASSGIDLGSIDPYRVAVYTGSGQTGIESAEFFPALEFAQGGGEDRDYAKLGGRASRLLDRFFSLRTLSNAGVGLLSVELGAKGASNNFVQGDTASALAIAAAVHDVADGGSDVAVAGGFDSLVTVSTYLAYEQAGLLSSEVPERAYRPFDRDRDGLVLGEGAAFVVLERESDARRRGGPVLGEMLGIGTATDPGDTLGAGASDAALRVAIAGATRGAAVDFVVAHGIGPRDGDRAEARVIDGIFEHRPPVTAFKSQTGYLGAATGAVELVLALRAARARVVPPIARHATPDEECRLSLVSGAPHALAPEAPSALCLAWSWFGQCTAIAVRASTGARPDQRPIGSVQA
jgi:3-oxoacyl-(acyl-carrier-protein) synthase